MLYWWLRPSQHVPTLEFRIADAATTVDEAVMLAGLSRAIAEHARPRSATAARPARPARSGWPWRRGGPAGSGSTASCSIRSAARRSRRSTWCGRCSGSVEATSDRRPSATVVLGTLERSWPPATRPPASATAFERRGRLEDVVEHVAAETAAGLPARV